MKYLFIYAHLDDETILSYGTMLKLAKNNSINILTLCGKGRKTNIQQEITIQKNRILAYKENCKNFKFKLCDNYDLSLTREIVKKEVEKYISNLKPDEVFTHSTADMHYEHRLIAEEVILTCRCKPNSVIKALYCTESQTAKYAYSQFGNFQPNFFVNISDYISIKKNALVKYNYELPINDNDLRSCDSILKNNQILGRQVGTFYCEAYQQIFKVNL